MGSRALKMNPCHPVNPESDKDSAITDRTDGSPNAGATAVIES